MRRRASNNTPSIQVQGPSSVTAGGAAFDLAYGMAAVEEDILAQDIRLTFDADQLEFVDFNSADESKFVVVDHAVKQPGQLRILGVHVGKGQTNPNGTLLKLTFKARASATQGNQTIAFALTTANGEGVESRLPSQSFMVRISAVSDKRR
ncbi:cohesin domain-containing protein [Paenibacillus aurantiacus]|uniref:Cohesin domain-containing protein n=1 Tax=Paenibacillus aurantiacus TaxID=1936118 RepID=A0ABV5KSX5_9BACL